MVGGEREETHVLDDYAREPPPLLITHTAHNNREHQLHSNSGNAALMAWRSVHFRRLLMLLAKFVIDDDVRECVLASY
jgi:hypothetical protein